MDDGFAFFDIIIFAMLAGYLVFQLRRVLGRRDGEKKPRPNRIPPDTDGLSETDNVVPISDDLSNADVLNANVSGLTMLRSLDPSFSDQEFITGSKSAFSWIVSAFAKGELEKLEPLISSNLFKNFEQEITRRTESGEVLDTNIVSIKSALINEVTVNGENVNITVEFVSDQVKALFNKEGEIIEGNPDVIETLTDLWTFNRAVKSSNPNWILIRTETPANTA